MEERKKERKIILFKVFVILDFVKYFDIDYNIFVFKLYSIYDKKNKGLRYFFWIVFFIFCD